MSYQGVMNNTVASVAGSISIARLVYQNSPEGKARAEQKAIDADYTKLKAQADTAKDRTGNFGEAVRQRAEKRYLETGDERFQTISEFTQDADEKLAQEQVDQATKSAESGLNAEKQQKRQKNSWRNQKTSLGVSAGELADRLGPKAKEILEKEMNDNG